MRYKTTTTFLNIFPAKFLQGLLIYCSCIVSVQAAQLEELQSLARAGAVQLALESMDRIQPDLLRNKKEWIKWEKARVGIYQENNNWLALAQRVEELPTRLPDNFMRWIQTEQARAYIMLGQGKQALWVLQNLIWNLPQNNEIITEWLPQWRRLVIDSYVNDNQNEDAQIAATRYYQGVFDQQLEDLLLRARIYLINNLASDAQVLLEPHKEDLQVAAVYLLAQLRGEQMAPNQVVKTAFKYLKEEVLDEQTSIAFWALIAEASQRSGNRVTTAQALEHVVADVDNVNLPDGLYSFNADTLWNSYIDFATWFGNRQQFLIGEDQQWFKAAEQVESKLPVRARSLYALLMLQGQDPQYRAAATERFVALMKKRKKGNALLKQLFMQSRQFARYETIPLEIRYILVDIALSISDIKLASRLMATIDEPPPGSDNFFWHLRRARIFVLGGDEDHGITALKALLANYAFLPKVQVDRLLQVVFDLQTVGAHEQAIILFNEILVKTTEPATQREIYFWLADSYKASDDYRQAARYYLKSATHIIEKEMDPWAQTSRYKAAEALAEAGLVSDARNLFSQLLEVTKEPSRRAVLQHELQKLWLLRDQLPSQTSNVE